MAGVDEERTPSSDVVEPEEEASPEPEEDASLEPIDEDAEDQAAEPTPEPEPEPDVPERLDLEVVEYGVSTFTAYEDSERASWALIVENPNEDAWIASSVDVTITLLDADDSVLTSTSEHVAVILPGQRAALADSTFDDMSDVASMRVQARVRDWQESDEGPFGTFETMDIGVRADDFGGWTITGKVQSSFVEDFDDVYAVAVLRDGDDNILGGGWTFVNFVPAGGDTSFQVDVLDDLTGVTSAEVYMALSSLSLFVR